jgi:hypothetical protein
VDVTLQQALETIRRGAGVAITWPGMLAVFASTVIAAAGWQRRQRSMRRERQVQFADSMPPDRSAGGALDAAAEAVAVLRRLQNLATEQLVTLEMAIEPGLAIQADQRALREILAELVRSVIERSPCGRILLTAALLDGSVHITVSDDGPGADGQILLMRLRGTERLIALQGGSMEIDARQGEGATVIVRLPAICASRHATTADRHDAFSARRATEQKCRADNVAH